MEDATLVDKTPHFVDANGIRWHVRITVRTVRDVKDRLGIDIRELCNDEARPLMELIADAIEMPRVLFVCCREQAAAANIDEDAFLDAIYGDVIDTAGAAFCQAFIDFFPNPKLRKTIATMLRMVRELRDEIVTEAETKVSSAIESVDVTSIAKSIVSPESSALLPTTSASAS
jgi:hypothetical protein